MICRGTDTLELLRADYLRSHDVKPGYAQQLEISARSFARWYESQTGQLLTLPRINEPMACEWLHWLRSQGRTPRTCNGKRGDLLTLWRHAVRRSLLPPPLAEEIVRFREPQRNPTAWTQPQLDAILAAAATQKIGRAVPGWGRDHDRAALLLIYDTAFRLSAVLALTTASLRDDGALLAAAETQKTLTDEIRWLGPDTLDAVRTIHPGLLFPAAVPAPLLPWPFSRRAFTDRWLRIVEAAGLPTGRREGPQKMRRTSASWCEAAAPGAGKRQLGHRTPGLAEKNYIDRTIAPAMRAADLLPRIGKRDG